ncbi:MAG: type 4a pilus biogenesis protein PilO [Phycisphaerales bacterium]|nr:type 4a pilus biogenesis protein PilO [Phycisphaerales bacterium]
MRFGTRELILFLAVLMVPIVSYFVIFKPQSANIDQAKSEIVHKREMLDSLRLETSRNEDLMAANESIKTRIDEMEALLPSNKEIDLVVRQVSSLAVDAGLSPPTLKSSKPVAAARFREQPLVMSTDGSFEGFYDFLLAIEQLPRITRIVDMTLKDSSTEGIELSAEFTLSIYFQVDEGVSP